MRVTAIIAAGGRGERFGGGVPKQLIHIAGRSMLERSVAAFVSHGAIADVIVALPADLVQAPPACLGAMSKPVRLVVGGARRQDSVARACEVVDPRSALVVVHDAARPFVSADLITRTIDAARVRGAAVAAVAVRDTVKRGRMATPGDTPSVDQGASSSVADLPTVAETLARHELFLAQTPQAFRLDILRDALARSAAETDATDEAMLAEHAGFTVALVPGDATNIKVTVPDDLILAEAIARGGETSRTIAPSCRVGTGYDLHRFVAGRPLILGGVTIPFDRGLIGHSDADAVCHAVTDAVLGGVAAGDIGRQFPDTDPAWRGASSLALLERAVALVRDQGFLPINVDVVVIAERPKLVPFIDEMRGRLAATLGIDVAHVSVKGKTNEGVGAIGRGEALAVHAVALLASSR